MDVTTRDYGIITVDESAIIRFDEGILGFEEYHNYVLLDDGNGDSPFRILQSMEESDLAFATIDPFAVMPDYEITLNDELVSELGICDIKEVAVLAIVVVPENPAKASFNLKAPLVINARLRKGSQYIVESDRYKVRHYIADVTDKGRLTLADMADLADARGA